MNMLGLLSHRRPTGVNHLMGSVSDIVVVVVVVYMN